MNTDSAGARQRVPCNRAQVNSDNTAGRITEVKEVTYIDVVSSAAEKMAIGQDVVKYVNAVEDAYMTARRRRNDTDGGSSDAPPRQRGRVAELTLGVQRGICLGEQVHETPPVQQGESSARNPRAEPIAVEPPAHIIEDSVDGAEEIEQAAPPVRKPAVRTAKRGAPKPPRPIRMMIGGPGFDIVAEFRDLPVSNMKWGTLMDMASALRRQIGAGLLLERRERRVMG